MITVELHEHGGNDSLFGRDGNGRLIRAVREADDGEADPSIAAIMAALTSRAFALARRLIDAFERQERGKPRPFTKAKESREDWAHRLLNNGTSLVEARESARGALSWSKRLLGD